RRPSGWVAIPLHHSQLLPYNKVPCMQCLHLLLEESHQFTTVFAMPVGHIVLCKQVRHLHPQLKEALADRFRRRRLNPFWMLIKKFKIVAEVEYIILRFILPRPEKIGTEASTAANHLPEFREAAYNFEEHQVPDFRHVDPRNQLIHRHG